MPRHASHPRVLALVLATALAASALVALTSSLPAGAANADTLTFTTQPASHETAGQAFAVVVHVTLSGVPVQFESINLTDDTGFLDNATSDAGGDATFNPTINKAGSDTLHADDQTTAGVTADSNSFTVDPGAPAVVAFQQQPTDTFSGQTITPAVTVFVGDGVGAGNGNPVPSTNVTMSIETGSGSLSGTFTQTTDPSGVATFNDLSIDTPDTYTLLATASGGSNPTKTSNPFTIIPIADLSITKTGPSQDQVAGDTNGYYYTITVANGGPDDNVGGFTVTDQLPSDVTYVSGTPSGAGSCSESSGTVTCTNGVGLANGDSEDFTVHVTIPHSVGQGTILHNHATVASDGTTDPKSSNDTSSPVVDTNVIARADLAASMTAPGGDKIAGDSAGFDYTIGISNIGPSDNTGGFHVTSTLPAGITFSTSGTDLRCGHVLQIVTCTRSTGLAASGSDSFTVHVTVNHDVPDNTTLSTHATVSSNGTTDPTPGNDTSSPDASVHVIARADLATSWTAAPDPGIAGTDETFTVKVHNGGPSDNTGYTLTMPIPTGATFVSAGAGCTGTGPVLCTSNGIAFGDPDQTYTLTVHISPSFANNVNNMAPMTFAPGITATSTTDPTPGNDTDSHDLTVVAQADINISGHSGVESSLTSGFTPLNPGNINRVTYTFTLTNGGPSDARNVGFSDHLPTTLDASTAQFCVVSGSITCTIDADFSSYTVNTTQTAAALLIPGESRTVKVRANLGLSERGGLKASGNNIVTAHTDTTDPDGDDMDSLSINIFTVPDAPFLKDAQAGNGFIQVLWERGSNKTGGDPGGVLGYDIIVTPTSPSGPAKVFFISGDTPNAAGNRFSFAIPSSFTSPTGPALTNGTTYRVTVEARNHAGDSSPSNSIDQTPCSTCVIKTVSSTSAQTLNTGGGTGCPGSPPKAPGATANDTIVSCYSFPKDTSATKVGFILAAREEPSTTGDCGSDTCLGNQVFFADAAGQAGTGPTILWIAEYDRTITTDLHGKPCAKTPCPSTQYIYTAYFNGQIIGTSLQNSWCPTGVIPTGAKACVVRLRQLNQSTAPNGMAGVGDVQLEIAFKGDPRGSMSG